MLKLRTDHNAESLRALARESEDANQARRLLALSAIYAGGSRSDAAKMLDVTLQIVRDWVLRFNAEGPSGLIDRKAKGATPKLNAEQRQALVQKLEDGPIPAVDGVVRWRLVDLAGWIHDEWGMSCQRGSVHQPGLGLAIAMMVLAASALPRTHLTYPFAQGHRVYDYFLE
jgi:transposase